MSSPKPTGCWTWAPKAAPEAAGWSPKARRNRSWHCTTVRTRAGCWRSSWRSKTGRWRRQAEVSSRCAGQAGAARASSSPRLISMQSRFEDRLAGRALGLYDPVQRIEAGQASQLPQAWEAIEAARRAGHWVALLLDYELGEWLAPETTLAPPDGPIPADRRADAPRLAALVIRRMCIEPPWSGSDAMHAAGIESVSHRLAQADYLRHIEHIRTLIEAGELYQMNYTQPLDVRVQGSPRLLYERIATAQPVAHAAYIEDAHRTVLSFSPELFVRRDGARLTTRPMKGTAPRHPDPAEDLRLGNELLASAKNRAENLMIVDLLRNDLGRLAEPGSVQVPSLFSLERYPTVWTMTSTVTALAPRATLADVAQALFPCGSVTGAPKVAAM